MYCLDDIAHSKDQIMLTTLACLTLGLFIGGYALSSFAPVSVAEKIYQRNWVTWGLFLALAFLQKEQGAPKSLNASNQPETSTLIVVVITGIAIAFVGGMSWARREDQRLSAPSDAD